MFISNLTVNLQYMHVKCTEENYSYHVYTYIYSLLNLGETWFIEKQVCIILLRKTLHGLKHVST